MSPHPKSPKSRGSIRDKLETFRISLKDEGKSLDNEQLQLFLQQLRRAERTFLQACSDELEPRVKRLIAHDPMIATVQANQAKWPEFLKPDR